MDINANVRERIALYRKDIWSFEDSGRMIELIRAGREWREAGGFTADPELLAEWRNLRAEYLRTYHG